MPRKPKLPKSEAPLAPVPPEILDQFVRQGPLTPEELDAAVRRFKKAIIERALGGELSHHLGYPPGGTKPDQTTNHRNGTSGKTVLTDDGPLPIEVPRDRDGTFEPRLIAKHERRFTGFDDKILALYARGMTVREIQAFLAERYAVEVSPDLISTVTDAVVAEVTAWQSRPLEPMYPVVFFDALRVKIRDEATVRSKAVYLALAVLPDGSRDILGIWIEQTEGAKFWMKVFTDLKTRGCHDLLIAVTDGLKGMSEALAAVFPATTLQTCIVHLIRNSLDFANWKERKPLAAALRAIYTAPSAEGAGAALDAFERGTRRRRMSVRMDAAVPVDAQTAPTGTWTTAQNAVSHSAHTHHRFTKRKTEETNPAHKISDTPGIYGAGVRDVRRATYQRPQITQLGAQSRVDACVELPAIRERCVSTHFQSPSRRTNTQDTLSTSRKARPWYCPPETPRDVTTALSP
jgi:putative transposase